MIMTLKHLRRYPPLLDLGLEFKVSMTTVYESVKRVIDILDRKLEYLRCWPRRHRSKILTGPLTGTIGAVDTFPICVPQPKSNEDRKRFYILGKV